jgi:dihydrodipicolinate synthase/N-acetylneuraminate lyase
MVADTMELPRGLICPLITPLKTGNQVDTSLLDRLISHVGEGADALLLGDLFWGEGLLLPHETRLEVVCAALEIIQGKWPVLITITSHTMKSTGDLLVQTGKFLERSNYPGMVFWVDYPIYYNSNRGLPQWYMSITSNTRVPFILGNHAGLVERRRRPVKHRNLRTSVLKKLARDEKIQGLIFTGSLKRSMNYHKAVRHRRGFKFYDGDEMVFVRQPSSHGVVAGGANLLIQAWREITWSCLNRYDAQQQYADHASQMLKTGAMLEAFYRLYSRNPAAVMKRMLYVAGLLPNAEIASGTPPTTGIENREVEAVCRKYGLV